MLSIKNKSKKKKKKISLNKLVTYLKASTRLVYNKNEGKSRVRVITAS